MPKSLKKKENHSRSKYTDPSMAFVEWVNGLGLEKTFFGKWLSRLEKQFRLKRLSFLFLFCFLLAFFLSFEVEKPYNYMVGQMAREDIYSPMSFEVVDEVVTEEKRLKAESNVPPIFDYDLDVFDRISNDVYEAFRLMRFEVRELNWPESRWSRPDAVQYFSRYKPAFEKAIGATVPDFVFSWLVEHRFDVEIENLVLKVLDEWLQRLVAENPQRFMGANQSSMLLRVVRDSEVVREFMALPSDFKEITPGGVRDLEEIETLPDFRNARVKDNVLRLARAVMVPNVTPNTKETSNRRKQARESVLPTVISIKKNQPIVSEGSIIQPSHMALIREIESIRADRRQEFVAFMTSLMLVTLIMVFFSYIRRISPNKIRVDATDLQSMGLVTFIVVAITKLFLFMTDAAFVDRFDSLIPASFFLYAAPVAAGPMLVGLLISCGEVVWLFTAFLAVVLGLMVEMDFAFMLVTLVGGMAAARGVYACKKRNDIYWAGVRTGFVNSVMIALVYSVQTLEQHASPTDLVWLVPAGFIAGILSSLVAMMFIPLLESIFNYTTDVRLLELSNLNHPLLKEMIVRAPGTYHHSMMVGSMVEAAAEEIGANPLLGKVMCYYHDIGKTAHSNYFIENQKPGQNPHDHISPYMSKTILIAHVKDGVELGMKYKLGAPIIDGILQHHGTTLISFFYNKALDNQDDHSVEVAEEDFRYPGPKPQFREAALCMLADSIEAAARSLDEPTPVRLQNIVRNIVQRKFMDGQLDECNLTLKDLSKVEKAFIRILLGIYHQRIDYPKSAGGGAAETPTLKLTGKGSAIA